MPLNDAQVERYSRQIILPEIGGRGQQRLLDSRLLLTTGGGPAADAARALAAAGVGRIALHAGTTDLAAELSDINSDLRIEKFDATKATAPFDAVLAGTDDSTHAAPHSLAWISGGVRAARAWVALGDGPPRVCNACRHDGQEIAHPYASPALGFAAAQMALAALRCLVGIDIGRTPGVSFFDLETTRWSALESGSGCVPCAVAGVGRD